MFSFSNMLPDNYFLYSWYKITFIFLKIKIKKINTVKKLVGKTF